VITIKITNIEAVVEKNKGWFVANVVGAFVDLEPRLELILIAKLPRRCLPRAYRPRSSESRPRPKRATAAR
jgi:hypothetical protein